MRFAVVPFNNQYVWFATTNEKSIITTQSDMEERKLKLAMAFSRWHDPIYDLISSTPASEIIMERALAHDYSVPQITSLHSHLNPQSKLLSSSELHRKYDQADQIKGYG